MNLKFKWPNWRRHVWPWSRFDSLLRDVREQKALKDSAEATIRDLDRVCRSSTEALCHIESRWSDLRRCHVDHRPGMDYKPFLILPPEPVSLRPMHGPLTEYAKQTRMHKYVVGVDIAPHLLEPKPSRDRFICALLFEVVCCIPSAVDDLLKQWDAQEPQAPAPRR